VLMLCSAALGAWGGCCVLMLCSAVLEAGGECSVLMLCSTVLEADTLQNAMQGSVPGEGVDECHALVMKRRAGTISV